MTDERRPRALVAAASRALAVAGLFDMHGHVSLREGDVAFINDHTASRIGLRPDEVAVVRIADGAVASGTPPSETALHLGVLRARPDVASVAHFHPLYATLFAVVGKPLVTAFNAGAIFGRVVPAYDEPDLVRSEAQGRAVAAALGSGRGALLRGHGVVVVGEDVPSCVGAALYLEETARRLWAALAIGEPRPYTDDEVGRLAEQGWQPRVVKKIWRDTLERARRAGALEGIDPALLR